MAVTEYDGQGVLDQPVQLGHSGPLADTTMPPLEMRNIHLVMAGSPECW